MNIAIVGNREGWTYREIKDILTKYDITNSDTIVSGGARGVDAFAETYAKEVGCNIKIFLPDSRQSIPERYFNRNRLIVDYSDIIIAFDKKKEHSGTKYTIEYARTKGKCVFLHNS